MGSKPAITAGTALRLSRYFNMTPQFWLNLQSEYDLRLARRVSWEEVEVRIRPRGGVKGLGHKRRHYPHCQVPVVTRDKGCVPAVTVGAVIGVRLPPAPMVNWETVWMLRFAT